MKAKDQCPCCGDVDSQEYHAYNPGVLRERHLHIGYDPGFTAIGPAYDLKCSSCCKYFISS